MTSNRVSRRRHLRRGLYARLRRAKNTIQFLAERVTALTGTAAAGFTFTTPATSAGAAATGTLTLTSNPSQVAAETVTLGAKTYAWVSELSSPAVANEVLVGQNTSDSVDNLIAAVNAAAGAGTTYGTGTTANAQVTAAGATDTINVTAITAGTAGNSIASTETMSGGAFGGATLSGGAAAVAATGTLTFTGQPANNDTVVLGSRTYTWKTTLTGAADEVLIGGSEDASRLNLSAAVNRLSPGDNEGVVYGTGTAVHADISAVAQYVSDVVTFTALVAGTAGNSLATTESMTNASFGAATLENGAAAVAATEALSFSANAAAPRTVKIGSRVYTFRTTASSANQVKIGASASASLDNLIAAINAGAGAGDTYGTGTTAHADVSAAAGAGDTMVVTALVVGDEGNSITTTENVPGSWGAATLASGADSVADSYFSATAHGLAVGDGPYVPTSSGTLPTGLPTLLWVESVVDANTFTMSDRYKGKAVYPQGAGSGTHTLTLAETAKSMFERLRKHKPIVVYNATDVDTL